MKTEDESFRRFIEGDESAFDGIMEKYFRPLVYFADRYVHDIHTAEDIAIDVFTYITVHPKRYNFRVSPKTYIFMLGRSRALDYLRHKKVLKLTELENAAELSGEKELEDILISDEKKKAVMRAVGSLPQAMAEAVHLVYFEDLSYEDAARVMKKSKKQVDNLLYRAKKELREILTKGGDIL